MKEFLTVLLMSFVMVTIYLMPFHISLLGQFHSIMNYVKQFLVIIMPNFEKLFDSTLSRTRYSSIHDYINKCKMYRKYVWATETKIITLTAILGITILFIFTHSLAGLEMEPRSCMAFLVILIHLLCI